MYLQNIAFINPPKITKEELNKLNENKNIVPTLKCESLKELIDDINKYKTNEVRAVDKTVKDALFWNAFHGEIHNAQTQIRKSLARKLSTLETKIAYAPDINKTMELKREHEELVKFFDSLDDENVLLNISVEELEKKTGDNCILFGLFNK